MSSRTSEALAVRDVTREDLIALLNEDLAREYQGVISNVVYSQVIKDAQYMQITAEMEVYAAEELAHALLIAAQIDHLGGMPLAVAKPVQTSPNGDDMLRFSLERETETIDRYRERVHQCEALGEYDLAELIREILAREEHYQMATANAFGVNIPHVARRSPAVHAAPVGAECIPMPHHAASLHRA